MSALIEIPLRSGRRRALVLAAAGGIAIILALSAMRFGIAYTLADSTNISMVQKALWLDRSNPDIQHRLGVLYNQENTAPLKAVPWLRLSVQSDARRASHWVDLAWTCLAIADQACAQEAFQRAIHSAPDRPHVELEVSNYMLVTGNPGEAVRHVARYMQLDPQHSGSVLGPYFRAFGDSQPLWVALGKERDGNALQMILLDYLAKTGRADQVPAYWREFVHATSNFPMNETKELIEDLVNAKRYADAAQVWSDLQSHGLITHDSRNLVFNGSFEHSSEVPAFDWYFPQYPYVKTALTTGTAHDGAHSLLVDYSVPDNTESTAAAELVPVHPNRSYSLSAYVHSDDVTSDSGPRLRVLDPECDRCVDADTANTIGITPWRRVAVTFTTGPQTKVVEVAVWRPRSRSFPMEISGRFWVDSVSLEPLSLAETPRLQTAQVQR